VNSYRPSLEELRDEVNADIDAFLAGRRADVPEAAPLVDEIARVVRLGGKRLRPAFCYWGYRAADGAHGASIVRIGSALELLHTFALVHDDIMDAADTRRGEPSTQAAHTPDFALLVGDLALVLADDAFTSAHFEGSAGQRAFAAYMRMKHEVIAGQYLDYEVARTGEITSAIARRIAVLKSGLYSVVEPLTIGALLAGADAPVVAALREFGAPLGEAFQLRDDLLGLFGDATEVGKPVGSDVREGKRTLLYVRALELSSPEQRQWLASRWGAADLAAAEITELTALIGSSGARAEVESLTRDLGDQARKVLDDAPITDEARAALSDLTSAATERLA
jgi:geranylgeranyl diphosphate synthase type I